MFAQWPWASTVVAHRHRQSAWRAYLNDIVMKSRFHHDAK